MDESDMVGARKGKAHPPVLLRIDIDVVLAVLGLLASAALGVYAAAIVHRDVYVLFAGLLGATCTAWLLIRQRVTLTGSLFGQSRTSVYALACLFFLTFLSSILLLYFRPEQYSRPLSYFVLMAVMAGMVALELLLLPPGRKYVALVISQILLLGLSAQFSQALLFPDVIGIDPALHSNLVSGIIANGHITPGADYSTTPLFHVEMAIGSLLMHVPYNDATLLLVSLPDVILPILAVFLLGRMILSERAGLMAALLLTLAPYHIYFGVWAVPNTYASILIPLIVYLLIMLMRRSPSLTKEARRGRSLKLFGMIVFMMVFMILTHPVASLGLAVVLLVLWSISFIYGRVTARRSMATVTLGTMLFFITAMVGWWTYVGDHIYYIGGQLFSGFEISYLTSVPAKVASFIYEISLLEQLLRYLGMFAFFLVAIMGCLALVSKRNRNLDRTSLAFAGLIPCAIGFVALAFALSGLDARWFFLAEMFMAVPAAAIMLAASTGVRHKAAASILVCTLVVSLAFMGSISPSGSIDNRDLFPNTGVRFAFTQSELDGAEFISLKADGPISSDFDYATDVSSSVFLNYFGVEPNELVSMDEELLNRTFTKDGTIRIVRAEVADGPVRLFALPYRLGYDPEDQLDWSEFSKIYDNRGIAAFL